jgi:hypothetical protein
LGSLNSAFFSVENLAPHKPVLGGVRDVALFITDIIKPVLVGDRSGVALSITSHKTTQQKRVCDLFFGFYSHGFRGISHFQCFGATFKTCDLHRQKCV